MNLSQYQNSIPDLDIGDDGDDDDENEMMMVTHADSKCFPTGQACLAIGRND